MELASEWHGRQDILSGMDELEMETHIHRDQRIACSTIIRNPVNSSAEETVPARLATPEGRSLSILLVDDVLANRKLVHAYLKATPHQIDIAENGEIAVSKFVSGTYDLVFMDIQMPVMDGYTATKAIRQWQKEMGKNPTPILALTAYVLDEAVQKSLEAGCNALLAKPIKKALLLDAINEYAEGVGE